MKVLYSQRSLSDVLLRLGTDSLELSKTVLKRKKSCEGIKHRTKPGDCRKREIQGKEYCEMHVILQQFARSTE